METPGQISAEIDTFVTHAGQIAARNANVGQVFRPDYSHLQGERDRAFSERWLRATASRIRSARSRSRLRTLMEGSGVAWRGIGRTKFAVSFSQGSQLNQRLFGDSQGPKAPTF